MRKFLIATAVGSLFLMLAIGAAAQERAPRYGSSNAQGNQRNINQRQRHQQRRIFQGALSDELTRREAVGLEREQRQIRTEERAYRADGNFTRVERRDVRQDLHQSSRHIYRAKHNNRDRN